MFTLLRNSQVYSPVYLGKKDILIFDRKIVHIDDSISILDKYISQSIDCSEYIVVPGFIDSHVHVTGGGGEGGPGSRMPELTIEMMADAGVTTVIGTLGTDGITRTVDSVLMKVKSLRSQGVSAWMYTGAYQIPPPTITGDITRDIALIEEIIGVGEIAISDHRSSVPTVQELAKLAGHARVAGMIGGKAGIVNLHMGDAIDPFKPIHDVIKISQLNYKQFIPTHCNRNDYIFEDAKEYGKNGYVDITTSSYPYYKDEEIKPSKALKILLECGVPIKHITFTSDACGSLPGFDPITGKLVKMEMGLPSSNLREVKEAVTEDNIPLEIALQPITSNPADILKLKDKGYLKSGYDADILILDQSFNIVKVMANGRFLR
jgi:beta-aspartyl-dipeptidase (metallo-type)